MITKDKYVELPYVAGDIIVIKKDYVSDKDAPDFYCVRIQEILLEQTGCYNEETNEYEHNVMLRVVDKNTSSHPGEYVSRLLYPEFIVAILDPNKDDLDELWSLDLGKYYPIYKEEEKNG